MERPLNMTDEEIEKCLEYLDVLWESDITDMRGAAPFISRNLGFSRLKSEQMLAYWMEVFSGKEE